MGNSVDSTGSNTCLFWPLFGPHPSGEFWPHHLSDRRPGRKTGPEQGSPLVLGWFGGNHRLGPNLPGQVGQGSSAKTPVDAEIPAISTMEPSLGWFMWESLRPPRSGTLFVTGLKIELGSVNRLLLS